VRSSPPWDAGPIPHGDDGEDDLLLLAPQQVEEGVDGVDHAARIAAADQHAVSPDIRSDLDHEAVVPGRSLAEVDLLRSAEPMQCLACVSLPEQDPLLHRRVDSVLAQNRKLALEAPLHKRLQTLGGVSLPLSR